MSSTFAALGVPAEIVARLAARGITTPTPIQAATLVEALAGRDVSGRAPTGSGKTLAFSIPLAMRVGKGSPKRPRALVLAPTRELASQIERELIPLAGAQGRTVASFYGGVGFGPQLNALRRGVDIAVACPGRLADLIDRREIRLDEVEIVVIDEADRMADMGFLPEVKRLLDACKPERQTLLFSATLDGDVDVLVKRYQRNPVRHEVEQAEDSTGTTEHVFWRVGRVERVPLVAQVIARHGSTVVFTRTKRGADRLVKQLGLAGVHAAPIHGDRSQAQRDRALADFQARRVQALVATDVAARGIHVDSVGCVMHFDLPADEKDYLHRSGRTGRAGANGTVVALVGEESVGLAKTIQRKLKLPAGLTPPDVDALPDDVPAPVRLPAADRLRAGAENRPHRTGGRPPARRDQGAPAKGNWSKDGRRRDPWATTPTEGGTRGGAQGGAGRPARTSQQGEARPWRDAKPAGAARRPGPRSQRAS